MKLFFIIRMRRQKTIKDTGGGTGRDWGKREKPAVSGGKVSEL